MTDQPVFFYPSTQRTIATIVAMDRHRGIGLKYDLPWGHGLKDDLQRFKDLTTGNVVVMGRKTYESIGKALPRRQNIVVTSSPLEVPGVVTATSLIGAYDQAEPGKIIFVIGGARMYAEAFATTELLFTTVVDGDFGCDVYMPYIEHTYWRVLSTRNIPADERNSHPSTFITYQRRIPNIR